MTYGCHMLSTCTPMKYSSSATLPEFIKTPSQCEQSSSLRKLNCRDHIAGLHTRFVYNFRSVRCAWRIHLLVMHSLEVKEVLQSFSCNSHKEAFAPTGGNWLYLAPRHAPHCLGACKCKSPGLELKWGPTVVEVARQLRDSRAGWWRPNWGHWASWCTSLSTNANRKISRNAMSRQSAPKGWRWEC